MVQGHDNSFRKYIKLSLIIIKNLINLKLLYNNLFFCPVFNGQSRKYLIKILKLH